MDLALAKETELQEELNEILKKNTLLEDEIGAMRKRLYESDQDKRNEDGQRDMLMRQIKDMEGKEEKRESYIKGIEKQLRQSQEENERLQADANLYDREIYLKIKELEQQIQMMSE